MKVWSRQIERALLGAILLCLPVVTLAGTQMMPDRDAVEGTPVVIWGNTTEVVGPITISFGDGTPNATPAFNINSQSYIAVAHTYAASGVYTATLTVNGVSATAEITVFDPATLSASDLEGLEINNAIQDGLRYQYYSTDAREANHDAGWSSASWAFNGAFTSMAVLAFENHGHTPGSGDIYSPVVQGGLNYVFSGLVALGLTVEPAGNPCVGGIPSPCNGLRSNLWPWGYSTSIALLAIVGSQTPAAIVGPGAASGQTYLEVAQRLVNTVAWGQADSGTYRGGWRYGLDDNQSDGSAIGWNVLGLLDAAAFGAVVPAFVAPELELEIQRTSNASGSMGYVAANSIPNTAKTGIRLQALHMVGVPQGGTTATTTVTPQASIDYINGSWNTFGVCGWGSATHPVHPSPNLVNGIHCIYSMFNVFKGLKLYGVTTLPNVPRADQDWHKHYQTYLQSIQTAPTTTTGGSFSALEAPGFGVQGETALGLLVLAPTALILPDPAIFADIGLAPETATNPVGTSHTVTGTARGPTGTGIPSVTIDFEVLTGPNSGKTGSGISDANGEVDFTYTDTAGPGTDTIQAFIGRGSGNELQSNVVEKIWQAETQKCDMDGDGDIDRVDIGRIFALRGTQSSGPDDPADLDSNGIININDGRGCVLRCTLPRCAIL